jgi:hypothetical protein
MLLPNQMGKIYLTNTSRLSKQSVKYRFLPLSNPAIDLSLCSAILFFAATSGSGPKYFGIIVTTLAAALAFLNS